MTRPVLMLTGATGRLGTQLTPALAEIADCVLLGFNSEPQGGERVDLTDRAATNALLGRVRPEILVHAAAETDVDACERDQAAAYRLNVEATRHLVGWLRAESPQTRLVYISTDQVYDSPHENDEDEVSPVNAYALTKLWAEDLVRELGNGLVLRTNFFGLGPPGQPNFVDWIIESCREGRPMTLFQDVQFNPLQIDDLAALIVELIERRARGTYNLGASGGGVSKAAFIRAVAARFDLPTDSLRDGSVNDVPLAARRPRDMRMAVTRIQDLLGRDLPTVAQGIERMARGWDGNSGRA